MKLHVVYFNFSLLAIQYLYGVPRVAQSGDSVHQSTDGLARVTQSSDSVHQSDDAHPTVTQVSEYCEDNEVFHFDAILQHSVHNQLKTFAFVGVQYLEIDELGLAPVSGS